MNEINEARAFYRHKPVGFGSQAWMVTGPSGGSILFPSREQAAAYAESENNKLINKFTQHKEMK